MLKYFIVISFLTYNVSQLIPPVLIQNFLDYKYTKYGILINCDNVLTNSKYIKVLNSGSKQISTVQNIEETSLEEAFKFDYGRIAVIFDFKCENNRKMLTKLSALNMFNNTYHWLILTSNYSTEFVEKFSNLNLNIDTEIIMACERNEVTFDLYDVYNFGNRYSSNLNVSLIGMWNYFTGFTFYREQYKYVRRANMTGVRLKCIVVTTNRLVNEKFEDYLQTPKLTHIDSMNRFSYTLLLHVRDMFNFSYTVMRTNSWGYSKNGTFDGMVGHLARENADIGGSPIFFRLERAKVIDYTIQTWVSRPCFIFRHPRRQGSIIQVYTRPFQRRVWYSCIGISSLILICLYLFTHVVRRNNIAPVRDEETAWSYLLLINVAALCQQGFPFNAQVYSIRIIILSFIIFAILFNQFYSASIVSSLLMQPPKNIKTLKDLLHSDLKAGVENIVYAVDYFAKTDDPIAIALYNKKIKTRKGTNYLQAAKGLELVKKGGFAFHIDIATGYKIIQETFTEQEVCELVEIQLFPPQRMVSIVRKHSPFRELFTYGLRMIAERGLMHRQKAVWHERKPHCTLRPDSNLVAVSLLNFSAVLLVLVAGIALSLFILLLECLIHKMNTAEHFKNHIPFTN